VAVCPPRPEESASTCASADTIVAWRSSRRTGRPTDLGFTRDRHQMCASRVNPTCDVRDAAHEFAESGRPEIAAPHHEAERDRVCIKLIGNRSSFFVRQCCVRWAVDRCRQSERLIDGGGAQAPRRFRLGVRLYQCAGLSTRYARP